MTGVSKIRAARRKRARRPRTFVALGVLALALMPAAASAQTHTTDDPRVGLAFGLDNPGIAAKGVQLKAHVNKAPGFFDPAAAGAIAFANSDLAIKGTTAFAGNFNGWQAYNISNPDAPTLITQVVCPGGQGDPSVWGNLLFISVEETRARTDCGTQGTVGAVDPARFRGVRIFDISNLAAPVQVAAVQTCRGSHTHTLVPDPSDANVLYIYNSGTSSVRSGAELAGCENAALTTAPVTSGNPTQWRIDIIRVPLGAPQNAAIVNQPRIFTDSATGAFNGLQNTQAGTLHPSGTAYSPLPNTNTCHDMTAFPEVGLLAGACQGNGILLDISDPVHPVRLDAVSDPNFSYWHSATFNNDGTKVIFTDEWGGGTSPRCRITDQLSWGANAIFDISAANKMVFKSYWKMPAVQTDQENCVAHNGNIVPVPGRDIFSQAWYQAGHTLVDFTDSAHPKEIGYFDRGRISETGVLFGTPPAQLGGLWSTYYYNGRTFGTEIARGFDVFAYTPTADLSANEIQAASEPQLGQLNAQLQSQIVHAPSFAVVRSYLDQLVRAGAIDGTTLEQVEKHLAAAEAATQGSKAKGQLMAAWGKLNGARYDALKNAIRDLADTY
jgi:hypothetical protein